MFEEFNEALSSEAFAAAWEMSYPVKSREMETHDLGMAFARIASNWSSKLLHSMMLIYIFRMLWFPEYIFCTNCNVSAVMLGLHELLRLLDEGQRKV